MIRPRVRPLRPGSAHVVLPIGAFNSLVLADQIAHLCRDSQLDLLDQIAALDAAKTVVLSEDAKATVEEAERLARTLDIAKGERGDHAVDR